ncbi:MAG: tetratricopeptide repeat protein [Candidatus Uhrbacteria bacterium]
MQDHPIIQQFETVLTTEKFNQFYKTVRKIFDGSSTWEQVEFIKGIGPEKWIQDFATSIKSVHKPLAGILLDSIKDKNYFDLIETIWLVCLKDVCLDKKVSLSKIDPVEDLFPDLSNSIFGPVIVLTALVNGPIAGKINALTVKEKRRCLTLAIGMWLEIMDCLMIEHNLNTTNPHRKKQIDEYINKGSKIMNEYYDLLESETMSEGDLRNLISKDPEFLDPYLVLADLLYEQGKDIEARELLRQAFARAMKIIVDSKGRWPKSVPWGWLENRHIVRAIDRWAHELWEEGRDEYALELFRKLFKSNPNDNIGARYEILALLMGYQPGWAEEMFPAEHPGFVDAIENDKWFQKYAPEYPGEFGWWLEEMVEN